MKYLVTGGASFIGSNFLHYIVNKYQYMGIFLSFSAWHTEDWRLNPSMHCSLIFTISQAISYVSITDKLPGDTSE